MTMAGDSIYLEEELFSEDAELEGKAGDALADEAVEDEEQGMFEHFRLNVDAGQTPMRVDKYMACHLEDTSRHRVQVAIKNGYVRVNDKLAKANTIVRPNDVIRFVMPYERHGFEVLPEDIPLDIVYEDDDFLIVNKPAGMCVHPGHGHFDGTLVNALLHHCGDSLSGIGGEKRPGIVHRIDRDTSGLIIAAKNDAAHAFLAAQLADHTLARTYECLAVGNFKEDSGTVDAPIGRHRTDRKKMAVVPDGRRAVTHWEVIARYGGVTHLRCRLETGRTHQIRVHLAHIGHPILGDTVYGAKKPVPGLTGQCLHATELQFIHPATGKTVSLRCPLPEEFTHMLEKLKRQG